MPKNKEQKAKSSYPPKLNERKEKKQAVQPQELEQFISLAEASELCSYSQEYLSLLARKGLIGAVKMGRNWVITRAVLFDYVQKNSVEQKGNHKGQLVFEEKLRNFINQNWLTVSLSELVSRLKAKAQLNWVKAKIGMVQVARRAAKLYGNRQALWQKATLAADRLISPVSHRAAVLKNPLVVKRVMATILLTSLGALSLYISPVAAKYYQQDFDLIAKAAQATIGRSFKAAKQSFNQTKEIYADTFGFIKNPEQYDFKTAGKYLGQGFARLGSDIIQGSVILANNFSQTYLDGAWQKFNAAAKQSVEVAGNLIISPANIRDVLLAVTDFSISESRKLTPRQSQRADDGLGWQLFKPKNILAEFFAPAVDAYSALGERIQSLVAIKVKPTLLAVGNIFSEKFSVNQEEEKVEPRVAGVSEEAQLANPTLNGIAASPLATLGAPRNEGAKGFLENVKRSFVSNFNSVSELGKMLAQGLAKVPAKAIALLQEGGDQSTILSKIFKRAGDGLAELTDLSLKKFTAKLTGVSQLSQIAYQNVFVQRTEVVTTKKFVTLEEAQILLGTGQIITSVQYITTTDGKVVALVGPAGPSGPAGQAGSQGLAGPQGATGPQGQQGLQGSGGASGLGGASGGSVTYYGSTPVNNNNTIFQSISAVDSMAVGGGGLGVGGRLTVAGSVELGNAGNDTLTVSGPATFNSNLAVSSGGSTTLGGSLSVANNASFANNVSIGGRATITASTGNFETKGSATISGAFAGATTTLIATGTNTLLTVRQGGTGDLFNLFDGGTEVFSVLDGGKVGLGTSTPIATLAVKGISGQTADVLRVASTTEKAYLRVLSTGQTILSAYPRTSAPSLLIQPYNVSSFNQATSTMLLVNASSTFTGDLFALQINGTARFRVDYQGNAVYTSNQIVNGNIYPATDLTFNLGQASPTRRWNDIFAYRYVYLGATTTSAAGKMAQFSSTTIAVYNTDLTIQTNNSKNILLNPSGNKVGVGTSTPSAQFAASSTNNIVAVFDQRGTSDILRLNDAGTTVFKVMDGGLVGIGTTTPKSYLSVSTLAQAVPTTKLFTVASTTGATLFTVLANGKVGIGTAAPTYDVDITKSQNAVTNLVVTNSNTGVSAKAAVAVQGDGGAAFLETYSTTFPASGYTIPDGAALYSNTGLSGGLAIGALHTSGIIKFLTGGYGDSEERMRITSAGKVGIGTTTPAARLQTTADTEQFRIAYSTDPTKYSSFTVNSSGNLNIASSGGFTGVGTTTPKSVLSVSTPAQQAPTYKLLTVASTTGATLFQVLGSGRVSVGATSSPAGLLSVLGNSTASALTVRQDSTGDILNLFDGTSEVMSVIDGGLVGIGTTTPKSYLSVSTLAQAAPATKLFTVASTTGASLFIVRADGKVGLSTSTPTAQFAINTQAGVNPFAVASSTGTYFKISSSGKVGIGTAEPGALLNVHKSVDPIALISTNSGNDATLDLTEGNNAWTIGHANSGGFRLVYDGGDNKFYLKSANGATINTRLTVERDSGNIGIGTTTPYSILSVSTAAQAAPATKLLTVASTTGSTLFQVLANGRVSVGATSSPAGLLSILGNSTASALTVRQDSTGDILNLFDGASKVLTVLDGGLVGIGTTTPQSYLSVSTIAQQAPATKLFTVASTTGKTLFTVLANGKVGIGTTTPLYLLHVNGNAAFGDSVTATNAERPLNLVGTNATMRVLRISANIDTASPAVELMHRNTPDGANNAYWDFFVNSAGFNIRDRIAGAGIRLTVATTTGNLGIGTTTPAAKLQAVATTEQLRLGYNSTNYVSFVVDSSGNMNIKPTGTGKVGVGTTTPQGQLSASSTSNIVAVFDQRGTSDILRLNDAGTTVFKVADGGYVGIGTNTPKSVLSVSTLAQAAPTTKLFTVASTTGATLLTVLGSGNVGIGTVNPNAALEIASTAYPTQYIRRATSGSTFGAALNTQSAQGTLTSPTALADTHGLGSIAFSGHDGTVYRDGAYIKAVVQGSVSSNVMPTRLVFLTRSATSGASPAEQMTIDKDGNIGIGDTGPDQKLEVMSSAAALTQLTVSNTNGGDYDAQIGFELADGTNTFTLGVDDSDSDKFKISGSALGTNDRLVIDTLGKVGIGTSTPYSILSISTSTQSAPTTKLLTVASTTGASLFIVRADGKVGLATSTPTAQLAINTQAGIDPFQIGSSTASYFKVAKSGQTLVAYGTVGLPALAFLSDTDTGLYRQAANVLGLAVGGVDVMRLNTIASGVNYFSFTPSATNNGLTLASAGSDTNVNMAVILKGTGKFGIGTTTPASQLSASSTSNIVAIFDQRGTSDILRLNDAGTTVFKVQDGGYVGVGTNTPLSVLSVSTLAQAAPATKLFTVASTTGRTILTVLANGRVGVGPTTSPQATLAIQSTQGQTHDLFRIGTSSNTILTTTTDASFFKVAAGGNTTIKGKIIDPTWMSEETGLTNAYDVQVVGNYAYVTAYTAAALKIIDISNPSNPVVVGSVSDATKLAGVTDVHVVGNYAYVAVRTRESLAVIDVSNPSRPIFLSEERGPVAGTSINLPRAVFVSGNYAYIGQQGGGIAVVDISNPADPVYVTNISTNLIAPFSIYVAGDYAYVADWDQASLSILDVSNPAKPVWVAEEQNAKYDGAASVVVAGNYAYMITANNDALAIFDVSNPTDPVEKSYLRAGGLNGDLDGARGVFVAGDYAYIVNSLKDSLAIVNVASTTRPYVVAIEKGLTPGTSLDNAYNVFVSGNYAYITSYDRSSLAVIDVSGLTVSNAEIGSLKVSNLAVNSFASFGQGAFIQGGLNVGQGAMFGGPMVIGSATSTSISATSLKVVATSSVDLIQYVQNGTGKILALYDGGTPSSTITNNLAFGVYDGGYAVLNATSTATALSIRQASTGDILNVFDGGSEILSVIDGGQVGIGTTTPKSYLSVSTLAQAAPTTKLFTVASTTGASLFQVLGSGLVGIGTTSPVANLTVAGSVSGRSFNGNTAASWGGPWFATGTKDLLAWYPLAKRDSQNGKMSDISGNERHGTITAGASAGFQADWSGRAESAYDFDALNTKINTNSNWIGAGTTTISAWIYLDGFGEASYGRIIDNSSTIFAVTSTNSRLLLISNGTTAAVSANSSIATGSWYHVLATRNSAGTANLYINGVLSGAANQSSGAPAVGSNVTIGNNTGQTNTFDGRISDLRAYNRVLSANEVAALYNSSNSTYSTRLGIGTTTPQSVLSVTTALQQAPATKLFTVASTTGATLFQVQGSGNITADIDTFVLDAVNNRIGIGTAAPGSIFDISSANPLPRITWTNTANFGSQYFYENTTLKGGFGMIGSTFTTTARQNDLELFTITGDITFAPGNTGNTVEFKSGGNVGIGTTTPAGRLAVARGTSSNQPLLLLDTPTSYAGRALDIKMASSSQIVVTNNSNVGYLGLGTTTPKSVVSISTTAQQAPAYKLLTVASTTGATLFQVLGSGRVSVGATSSPAGLFSVLGNSTATALTVRQDSTGDILNLFDGASEIMTVLDGGLVGIGTTTPKSYLSVSTLAQAAPTTKLFTVASTTGATLFVVRADGKVGIGTSTPTARLAVSAAVQSSTPLFRVASTTNALLFQVAATGDLKMANNKWFKSISAVATGTNELNIFKASTSDEIIGGAKMKFDITKGLIGWYSMAQTDLKSSTVMADKSGNQRDATITVGSSAGFKLDQKGQPNRAYDFDNSGAGTKITLASSATMFNPYVDEFAIAFWIRPDWIYTEDASHSFLFSNGYYRTSPWLMIQKRENGNGNNLQFSWGTNQTNYVYANVTATFFQAGQWTHIVITKTGANSAGTNKLYVNGVLQSGFSSATEGTPASTVLASNFIFGADASASGADSHLADLRIYKRAFGATEVVQLYEQYNPGLEVNTLSVTENTQAVRLVNLNVTSALASGSSTIMTFAHDNSDLLTLYAQSNGSGGVQNQRVGIGTTTPTAFLHAQANTTATALAVRQDSTGDILNLFDGASEIMTVLDGGLVGIGTTTPLSVLSVSTLAQAAPTTKLLTVASTTGATLFQVLGSGQSLHSTGTVAAPSISFVGDTNTGFRWESSDRFNIVTGGVSRYIFSSTALGANTGANGGGAIFYVVTSATAPGIGPASGDSDTGIGRAAADQLSMIAGGAEIMRYNTVASSVNRLSATSSATGNAVRLGVQGSDTNVSLTVLPQGTGKVGIGSTTPVAFLSVSPATSLGSTALFRVASTTNATLLTVEASGRVGIGITTPLSVLSVSTNAQAAPTTKLLTVASTTGATLFQVLASGKVGIGTAAPSTALHVIGNSLATSVTLIGATDTGISRTEAGVVGVGTGAAGNVLGSFAAYNFRIGNGANSYWSAGGLTLNAAVNGVMGWHATNATGAPDIGFSRLSAGVVGVGTGAAGNILGTLIANKVGVGTTTPAAQFAASSTSNIVAMFDQRGTSDILRLNDAGTTVFKVQDGGYVGIGTNTPSSILSVSTAAQAAPTTKLLTVASTTGASLFQVLANGRVSVGPTSTPAGLLSVENVGTGNSFIVSDQANDTTPFVVNASGSVGIGIAVPGVTLDVNGSIRANSAVYSGTFTNGGGESVSLLDGTGIRLLTNSVEWLRVTEAGLVGIGTTTPAGRLAVARGNSSNQPLLLLDTPTSYAGRALDIKMASSSQIVVTNNSNVGYLGLGTTTPKSVLAISTTGQQAPTTKLFTVASTTGRTLFQVLANGNTTVGLSVKSATGFTIKDREGTAVFNLDDLTTTTLRTFTFGKNDGSTATSTGIRIGYGGICVDNDGGCQASTTGRVSARSFGTSASDVAENYPSVEELEPGDLVMADSNNEGYVMKTTGEYSNNVIGVVSSEPGILMGAEVEGYPIALVGRIPTKVSNVNGAIRPGDSLTVAPVPGYAMKLNEGDTSKVIGTALESFNGQGQATGLISMFINPDYRSAFNEANFGNITDGQIATNAAISDLKLGTIRTAGKIALTALPVEIALLQGDTQTFRGNYIFGAGAETADLVVFNARIGSDIKFAIDGLYNVGSNEAAAANVYTKQLNSSKIVVAADLSAQNMNIDDYGLYLAASSGNAFFGDNVIVGGVGAGLSRPGGVTPPLQVVSPTYPDFVMDGGDLLVNDDLGIGGDLYVVGNIRVAGAMEFAREGIAQMMSVDGIVDNGTPRSARGGDVVVINASGTSQGVVSNQANSSAVLGVVGTSSGAVFGSNSNDGDGDNAVGAQHVVPLPVVVSGVAVVNVSAENGPIHKGDQLTTSDSAGYAMLATRPGAGVLGLALEDLAEGQGNIRVLVDLGTYFAPTAKVITVASSGADFRTITRALDSIDDNSAQNRYIIKVGPGVYEEQITMKDYVDVVGEGNGLVIIQSDESPVIIASAQARLEGVTIKSTSSSDEPVLVSISSGNPILQDLNFVAETANQAVGVSITGEPTKVSLNKLTFDSNYSQAIVNLASTTVAIMHSDLSEINGTAMVAQNGLIKSYFNSYDGVFGDINVATGVRFVSIGDQYAQVSNSGIFLDSTNQGKVDSDYIDYGWLVEETEDRELNIKVSAGEGYINGVKVNTAEITDIVLVASSTNYIMMSDEGEIMSTTTQTVILNSESSILIATVQTDATAITGIANERSNEVTVAKQGGQYRSISAALEAITSASANNRWTITVQPGVYNEQVALKPFVDIIGSGKDNTTVMSINQPVIISDQENAATSSPEAGLSAVLGHSVKIANLKLSLAGDTSGQAVVDIADLNLTLEDVNITWSGNEGVEGAAVEVNGASEATINRLNAFGVAYGITSNVINDGSATSTVEISYSNISSSIADIRTVNINEDVQAIHELPLRVNIVSSYNTLTGAGTNFEVARGTIVSSAHDTYLKYQGEGEFRQNDYFRNNNNAIASLFNIQNAGFNLFNVTASGTIAINPQNTTGDSVIITSSTASSTLTVVNTGAGTALKVVGDLILTSATSGIPVVLSSAGAELNVGSPGDIINLNIEGVVYNFKENVRRDTMSAYLSAPVSGDKVWGDGQSAWSPAESITILGAKMQYACEGEGVLQMTLKDKNGNTITDLNGFSCGGFYKVEASDLEYHLTPADGMYVDVVSAVEGITNVTITIEFVYDNR